MWAQARLVGSNTLTVATVEVVAAPAGSDCSYTCTYTAPPTPGRFVLEVTSRGRHVGGSPFSVRVSAVMIRVHCLDKHVCLLDVT
jgi:hypothetical protein